MSDALNSRELLSNVEFAVVTFAGADRLPAYRDHVGITTAVLADPERKAYRAYGLVSASLWRVYRPATLKKYAVLLRAGKRLRKPTEDTRQLGGDFVIGRDGRIAYAYRPVAPDDRPPPHVIADAAARAARGA